MYVKLRNFLKLTDSDLRPLTIPVATDTAGGSKSKEESTDMTANSSDSKTEGSVILVDDDASKRRKVDDSEEWIRVQNMVLRLSDRPTLLNSKLDEKIINAVQKLLLQKFPSLKGFKSTLVQDNIGFGVNNYLQVVHSRSNHWIMVATIGCQHNEIIVYDSLYNEVDCDISVTTTDSKD